MTRKENELAWKQSKFTSTSYSRYTTYEQCPFKAKLAYLDKVPEPQNAAMARGSDIHGLIEKYLRGQSKRLAVDVANFRDMAKDVRHYTNDKNYEVTLEYMMAFDNQWISCAWNDWDKCAVRIKTDVMIYDLTDGEVTIIDWKTGKHDSRNLEKYLDQMEIYALGAFKHYTQKKLSVDKINVMLIYVDNGDIEEKEFLPGDIIKLEKKWTAKFSTMFKDTTFKPKPSFLCRWCHYRKDNAENGGGQCQF